MVVLPFCKIDGFKYTQFYLSAKPVTLGKVYSSGLSIYLGSSALVTNIPLGTMVHVVLILISWHLSLNYRNKLLNEIIFLRNQDW